MSLFDSLKGAVSDMLVNVEAAVLPDLLSKVMANTELGSVQGLLGKLQESGLAQQVSSWLGSGANLPVTPEQLQSALGSEQLQHLASGLGIPVDKISALLAQHLPSTIDAMSPNGEIETPNGG